MTLLDELPGQVSDENAPEQRRRGPRRRKKLKQAKAAPVLEQRDEILTPHNAKGTRLRQKRMRAGHEFYAPAPQGAPTTTRQSEILNTAVVSAPRVLDAPIIGIDTLSDGLLTHDSFLAYEAGLISSPNVVVIGDVGSLKSTQLKTGYVIRPLLLEGRRVVVIDKKPRNKDQAEGEYAETTRAFGSAPITFSTEEGEGVVLNPMDPLITGSAGTSKDQIRLLRTIAELSQEGQPLTQWESESLRSAYRAAMKTAQDKGRDPVLTDVHAALGRLELDPSHEYDHLAASAENRLREAGTGVQFLLNGLLEEYSGVFDGETSSSVQLSNKLTSFDVSQLPEDGPLISMVISIVNMWLLGALKRPGAKRTNFVIDEGWHVMNGPVAKLMRSNTKLARSLGLSLITAFHKLADVPTDSPAMALIQEAQTIHLMRQSRDEDVARCVKDFGLDPASKEIIQKLELGYHIFKRGTEPERLVQHLSSQLEIDLTDTDEAMRGRAA